MVKGAGKGFLFKAVAAGSFREPDDINLAGWKKSLWLFIEKEQANVFGQDDFVRTPGDIHLSAQLRDCQFCSFIGKPTAYFA